MGYLYDRGSMAHVLCTKTEGKDAKLITKYLNTVLDSDLTLYFRKYIKTHIKEMWEWDGNRK